MENNIKVSVLMPIYNTKEEYLRESIESILNQTFTDFELIIVNDGSTNNVEEVVKSYDDNRIKYVLQEHMGISKTRNHLLSLCDSEYVAFFDSDDIAMKNRLEMQVEYLDKHKDVSILGTNCILSNSNKCSLFPEDVTYLDLYEYSAIAIGTSMMRTEDLKKFNLLFDINIGLSEDYEFFTRAIRYLNIRNLEEALITYRILPNSLSRKNKFLLEQTEAKIKDRMLDFLTNDKKIKKKLSLLIHDKSLSFSEKIFSITRNSGEKIITILGRKIILRKRSKS